MALDPGVRRVGLAVSDELGVLASPLAVIRRSSRGRDLEQIRSYVQQLQPSELIVGLPLLPSGEAGPQARYSERFAAWLREELGLPVRLWNESFSTVEACRLRGQAGRRRRPSVHVDAEAAAITLQDFLDRR
jgi:putative Holliday junction resolvase